MEAFRSKSHSNLKYLLVVLALLPPLVVLLLLTRHVINVPLSDEWEWTELAVALRAQALTWSTLWAQHNEHRMLFPKVLTVILMWSGGWRTMSETLLGLLLLVCTQFVLLQLLRRTIEERFMPLTFFLASLVLYSLAQYENYLWGFQFAWYLVNLMAVISIWLLTRYPGGLVCFVCAVVTAYIGSYSSFAGLNVWLVGGVILALNRSWRRTYLLAWCGAAILCVILFLQGYQILPNHRDYAYFIAHPFAFLEYVLAYIGSPIARDAGGAWSAAYGLGAVVAFATLTFVFARDRGAYKSFLPWIALGGFTLLSAFTTAIGRSDLGVGEALASRYTSISGLFWISLIALSVLTYDRHAARLGWPLTYGIALGGVLLGVPFIATNIEGFQWFSAWSESATRQLAIVHQYVTATDDQLRVLYPSAEALRRYASALHAMGDGPFLP
jgi:hypothetical protein